MGVGEEGGTGTEEVRRAKQKKIGDNSTPEWLPVAKLRQARGTQVGHTQVFG